MKFQEYHPYLTYISDKVGFITDKGVPINSGSAPMESGDLWSLWNLGKKAFSALPSFSSSAEFDEAYAAHQRFIEHSLRELKEQDAITKEDHFVFNWMIRRGIPIDNEILSTLLKRYRRGHKPKKKVDEELKELQEWKDHFLFACLIYIDRAISRIRIFNIALDMADGRLEPTAARFASLIGIRGDLGAAEATMNAADAFTNYETITGKIELRISKKPQAKGGIPDTRGELLRPRFRRLRTYVLCWVCMPQYYFRMVRIFRMLEIWSLLNHSRNFPPVTATLRCEPKREYCPDSRCIA